MEYVTPTGPEIRTMAARLGGLIRLEGPKEQIQEVRWDVNCARLATAIDLAHSSGGLRSCDRDMLAARLLDGGVQ